MPILFKCSSCKNRIKVRTNAQGKKVRCPQCQELQRVPIPPADKVPAKPATEDPLADLAPLAPSQADESFWEVSSQDPSPTQRLPEASFSAASQAPRPSSTGGSPRNPSPNAKYLVFNATVLLVVFGIIFGLQIFGLGLQLLRLLGSEGFSAARLPSPLFYVVGAVLMGLVYYTITLLQSARRLENYTQAILGFILATVILTPACLIIPLLPFCVLGFWYLSKPDVKNSFRS
ncbi:hypothetical protein AB1K70_21490 [Bremerella sp. JC770]|uniref:hypothetical protein n=1 Tax=Bremerella sp. JC770 TaxID=3232137 RepID=UPI00345745C8